MQERILNIITINYNDSEGLEKTLSSIKSSSGNINFRCFIVDGGSSDNSLYVIEKYNSYIYKYISEKDNGIYDAMNKGINLIEGDGVVLFLNSGDVLSDEIKLDDLILFINNQPVNSFIFSDNYLKVNNNIFFRRVKTNDVARGIKLPSHQAVILPISYLRDNNFDIEYNISADSKLLRNAINKLKLIKYKTPISIFSLGGVSNNWGSFKKFIEHSKEYFICNEINGFGRFFYLIKGMIKFTLIKLIGYENYYSWTLRFK